MPRAIALAAVLLLLAATPALGAAGDGSVREMGAAFGKCMFAIAALVYVVGKLR
jgi:hypothetical protein